VAKPHEFRNALENIAFKFDMSAAWILRDILDHPKNVILEFFRSLQSPVLPPGKADPSGLASARDDEQ
jgi:hypothetical protein